MTSCESFVSKNLHDSLHANSHIEVLAWHPPDAKSYFTREIQLSYTEGGRKRRYILDMICSLNHCALLIECKCDLSESLSQAYAENGGVSDAEKLSRIISFLGPDGIAKTLALQNPSLRGITLNSVIPCLAVKHIDTEIPVGFIVFEVTESLMRIHSKGAQVLDWQNVLQEIL